VTIGGWQVSCLEPISIKNKGTTMTLRKTTSLTTLLSFILLLITSVILYITPHGRVAYWANWEMVGLGKEQWGALHINLGLLFIIAGIVHTVLNWDLMMLYLKNKAKQFRLFTADFNIALIITLFITIFTLFELPPVNAVQTFNETLKEAANKKYGEPPYGHADESTLLTFCKRTGLDLNESKEKFAAAGIRFNSDLSTLAEIAQANQMTPQQVYDAIKTEGAELQSGIIDEACETISRGSGSGSGSGMGRKTLADLCAENGIEPEVAIAKLKEQGIDASADSKVKTLADKNGVNPSGILEAIK
jgi:hypothetical protein